MKIMIIGLGNFGSSLAVRLTGQGHEVLGIDRSMPKVESLKDSITRAICVNINDKSAIQELPVREMDAVVIAIGEHLGDSILATALLKEAGAKQLFCRALNDTHLTILKSLQVDNVLLPENDAAIRFSYMLVYPTVRNAYEVGDEFEVIEIEIPKRYENLSLSDLNFRKEYQLDLLMVKKAKPVRNLLGKVTFEYTEILISDSSPKEILLGKNDLLVIFGSKKDIARYLKI